jgi:predicted component of type VI protein secretion system
MRWLGLGMSTGQRTTSYLVTRLEDEPDRAVVWDTLEITVGRQKGQDILVDDLEVSRQHALFRREGQRFTVEDLGTGLGTLVNGEAVASHELRHGDLIQVGKLELRFGQTTERVQAGGNVTFASHLKGGGLPSLDASASGRTMLGFDPEDSLLFAPPTVPSVEPGPRAVAEDGSLEALESMDPLGLSIDGTQFGTASPARDLDRELGDKPDEWDAAAAATPPLQPPSAAGSSASSALERAAGPASQGELTTELRLVIAGPATELAALVAVLRDRRIQFGSLQLHIRERES